MRDRSMSQLASEGERLCKLGDCENGIKFFEESLKVYNQTLNKENNGTNTETLDDIKLLQTLSIIYNQMGNAYFYLQDYQKALEFHKKDLELSDEFGDEAGKAKACGKSILLLKMIEMKFKQLLK
jgi:G-protein signaling modulator 2